MAAISVMLETEREAALPTAAHIEAAIHNAQAAEASLRAEIDQAKRQARTRKQEIAELKQWYAALPQADQLSELDRLHRDIAWRGAEINTLQAQIGALETRKLAVTVRLETATAQREAHRAGVYTRPLEEDPRWQSVQTKYRRAVTALAQHKAALQQLQQAYAMPTS